MCCADEGNDLSITNCSMQLIAEVGSLDDYFLSMAEDLSRR